MAGVAAFADVDVAAGQFERRVDPHVRRALDGLVDREQRRDLDEAANAGDDDDGQHEAHGVAFDLAMEFRHVPTPPAAGASLRSGSSSVDFAAASVSPLIVIQTLYEATTAPIRNSSPPKVRAM